MNQIEAIIADQNALRENVAKFLNAVKVALEEFHSDEVSRQNELSRHQDGIESAIEAHDALGESVFAPVLEAHDQARVIAARLGIALPEAEF